MIVGIFKAIVRFLRANFIAGVFIAVPFAITIWFLSWAWNYIQSPLNKFFKIAAGPDDTPWANIFDAIQSSDYNRLFVPMVSLALILFSVLLLGILTRSIIGRMALLGVESVVSRVPIVGMLYSSLKQLGEAFITTDGHSKFQRAVAVQFPYKGCWAIGFVTGKAATFLPPIPNPPAADGGIPAVQPKAELLTIFVPTTPLPTAGFMIAVPETETLELDMSVQDALKLVVSGGMLSPGESHRLTQKGELTKAVKRGTDRGLEVSAKPGTVER